MGRASIPVEQRNNFYFREGAGEVTFMFDARPVVGVRYRARAVLPPVDDPPEHEFVVERVGSLNHQNVGVMEIIEDGADAVHRVWYAVWPRGL